jgi:hypothetical protein
MESGRLKARVACQSLPLLLMGLLFLLMPMRTEALTFKSYIGSSKATCPSGGYITPSTNFVNTGELITVTFVNENVDAGSLEVRQLPGVPDFSVPAGGEVTRSFSASGAFVIEVWLSGSCKVASANYSLNPTTQPAAPSPSAEATTSETQNQNSQSEEPGDKIPSADNAQSTNSKEDSKPRPNVINNNTRKPTKRSFPWWLVALAFLLLALLVTGYLYYRWSRRRSTKPRV